MTIPLRMINSAVPLSSMELLSFGFPSRRLISFVSRFSMEAVFSKKAQINPLQQTADKQRRWLAVEHSEAVRLAKEPGVGGNKIRATHKVDIALTFIRWPKLKINRNVAPCLLDVHIHASIS